VFHNLDWYGASAEAIIIIVLACTFAIVFLKLYNEWLGEKIGK
jgi:hypothetical protein